MARKVRRPSSPTAVNDHGLKQFVAENGLQDFGGSNNLEVKYYLDDATGVTLFDAHYTYHPAWACRRLAQYRPSLHVDIGSTVHFCTMLSAFIPVEFYDFRPAALTLSQLACGSTNLTSLHFADNSIESLSCMHTVEHVGLGRYGDPIDGMGDAIAMSELQRVVKPGGHLLFVVPIGKPKVVFNAHRIYNTGLVMSRFHQMKLIDFTLIADDRSYTENASFELADVQDYGCGCFHFQKR